MTFYCKKCKSPMRHRGGECYWCKTCKESHVITRLPNGVYIEDPKLVAPPTEEQKKEFLDYLQKLKEKRDEADNGPGE